VRNLHLQRAEVAVEKLIPITVQVQVEVSVNLVLQEAQVKTEKV